MARSRSTLTAFGVDRRTQPGEALAWSTPAHQGDGRITVAVDVGKAAEMGRLVAASAPSTLILTHDDDDHIGGWDGFAATGLSTLEELWVPYEWDAVVQTMSSLAQNAHVHVAPEADDVIERLHTGYDVVDDSDRPERPDRRESSPPLPERVDLTQVLSKEEHEGLGSIVADEVLQAHRRGEIGTRVHFIGTAHEVAERAIERAHQIQGILLDCARAGVTVRLFSVDGHSANGPAWFISGAPRIATVANAVPVVRRGAARAAVVDLARLLVLSIQNVRALCPVLWHAGGLAGGAIVWSDSPGTWATTPEADDLLSHLTISTAPHHGSANAAHDPAWDALWPFHRRDDTVMLCAGGQWNQKVRPEYTALSHHRRGCTRCRHVTPRGFSRTITAASDGSAASLVGWHCAR